jgi:hypothetical protein
MRGARGRFRLPARQRSPVRSGVQRVVERRTQRPMAPGNDPVCRLAPILERLTQAFDRVAPLLQELVEEQHAVRRERAEMAPRRGLTSGWMPGSSGRSHRTLGHFPFVRCECRQDFILLTRRDPDVIECASQLSRDLIELFGVMWRSRCASSSPRGVLPGFVAANDKVHRRRCRPTACA